MTSPTPVRQVTRVRYELRRREVKVAAVERISPQFVGVTFIGEELADFVSGSFDDHVKFMIDDGSGELARRDYTPRRFDQARRELVLEFALHGHGGASDWAVRVETGMTAVIGGPRGSMIIPPDYNWHLLIGDATAVPAIHRRLEELPATSRALVLIQLAAADRRQFGSAAALELQWVDSSEALLAAARTLVLPAGEGYVWGAGEATVMTRLRDLMLHEKGVSREAMRIAAYWKQGSPSFHENL